jgi:signal recognition particle subunit SRP54
MLPGVGKMKDQLAQAGFDDRMIKRQQAIISSMTKQERRKPDVLNGSRRKRIAAGAGTDVQEVNKLMKMHRQMADVMKQMGKGKGLFGSLFGGRPPPMPPGGLPGLGGPATPGQLPNIGLTPGGAPRLPGLPGGLPSLPPGFGRKK